MNADDSDGARFHVGSTIAGRYRVERPIGEGAMGAVALARHVTLDETVAIKFLRPELRRDPVANARLAREAKALARIKSDHVARVLDVGVTLSVGPYMVMEYLEGIDLGEVLETEGPLPVPRAVECVLQVCEALTVAHTAGIVHRDIKPQNLFLARHGRFETLKILDFGIAEDTPSAASPFCADPSLEPLSSRQPLSSLEPLSSRELLPPAEATGPASSSSGPASGVAPSGPASPVYGTPSYMAPERVRNDPDADHRSDIWSVGVVLHELVTGRAVFDADSITETCARIVSDEPIALEQNDRVLPPNLRAIIEGCLQRDPALRYQSVEQLTAALAPLATMHERFRGRSTGAFSRQLLDEELALRFGLASERGARTPAPPGTWQHAAASLRAWGARIWESTLPRYVGLGMASVLLAGLGVWLSGIRWMAPPPSAVPLRAEPTASAREPRRDVVESVLPLATPGGIGTLGGASTPAGASTEPVASSAPAEHGMTVDESAASGPGAAVAHPHGRPRLPSTSSPTRGAERAARRDAVVSSSPSNESGSRSSNARSRVRLVKDQAEAKTGSERGAAAREARKKDEPVKKERPKKARPVPPWLQTPSSNAVSPEP